MAEDRANRDLVLTPEKQVYMLDTSKGDVRIWGACAVTQTGQDIPVIFNPRTGEYEICSELQSAVQKRPLAVQRDYMVLYNPAKDGSHPDPVVSGRKAPELDFGRKVNIPGPVQFFLWPGQAATRIPGHQLRSNQYLLVKVYDAEEARRNWDQAVVETKTEVPDETKDPKAPKKAPQKTPQISTVPKDLAVGKHYIVKGTEVSFYIPPTGVSVVPDDNGNYVRNALTLELLEYAILVDEDGNKEYPRGPDVVFPRPTQTFIYDRRGNQKFKAVELNELQGIYVKVITPYVDEQGVERKAGDELFIKGDTTPIYYPREEHSLISYDGRSKHYATAVPAGEARYVMDRISGEIRVVHGPTMLLPDPRHEVIVRRVLTERQCKLLYPKNEEVLEYNRLLREMASRSPTTRAGAVSEGDFERGSKSKRGAKFRNVSNDALMQQSFTSSVHAEGQYFVADEFSRASTYTEPRTVTLNTRLEGVPTIQVWPGFAVQVTNKSDDRRVVIGPSTVQLGYDEDLEYLGLSTGSPKTTSELYHTAYLNILANKVSDTVVVETKDHATITLKLSLLVNFEGDENRWFNVGNYVKLLTDRVRSLLKGAIQKMRVSEFHERSIDIIRDIILKPKPEDGDRPGLAFSENGMVVRDVEVLKVHIQNENVHRMLLEAQLQTVASNIEIESANRELEAIKELERIDQEKQQVRKETAIAEMTNRAQIEAEKTKNELAKIQGELAQKAEKRKILEMTEADQDYSFDAELARKKRHDDQVNFFEDLKVERHKDLLVAETKSAVDRFGAAQEGFSESIVAMQRERTLVDIAQAASAERFIGGDTFGQAFNTIFAGLPQLLDRFNVGVGGNGKTGRSPKSSQ